MQTYGSPCVYVLITETLWQWCQLLHKDLPRSALHYCDNSMALHLPLALLGCGILVGSIFSGRSNSAGNFTHSHQARRDAVASHQTIDSRRIGHCVGARANTGYWPSNAFVFTATQCIRSKLTLKIVVTGSISNHIKKFYFCLF